MSASKTIEQIETEPSVVLYRVNRIEKTLGCLKTRVDRIFWLLVAVLAATGGRFGVSLFEVLVK